MYHWDTMPQWKMPDNCVIQDHTHHVCLRIDFEPESNGVYTSYIGDLTDHYLWAKENKIFMEHNMLRQGKEGKRSLVMFVFENAIDAVGFKLSWKEYR